MHQPSAPRLLLLACLTVLLAAANTVHAQSLRLWTEWYPAQLTGERLARAYPDSALAYSHDALAIAREMADTLAMAKSHALQGWVHHTRQAWPQSIAAYQTALSLYLTTPHWKALRKRRGRQEGMAMGPPPSAFPNSRPRSGPHSRPPVFEDSLPHTAPHRPIPLNGALADSARNLPTPVAKAQRNMEAYGMGNMPGTNSSPEQLRKWRLGPPTWVLSPAYLLDDTVRMRVPYRPPSRRLPFVYQWLEQLAYAQLWHGNYEGALATANLWVGSIQGMEPHYRTHSLCMAMAQAQYFTGQKDSAAYYSNKAMLTERKRIMPWDGHVLDLLDEIGSNHPGMSMEAGRYTNWLESPDVYVEPQAIPYIYHGLALRLMGMGKYRSADSLLRLTLAWPALPYQLQKQAYLAKAFWHHAQGTDSMRFYTNKVIDMAEEDGQMPFAGTLYHWLAQVAAGNGNPGQAMEYARAGLGFYTGEAHHALGAKLYHLVSELQLAQGKLAEAHRSGLRALATYDSVGGFTPAARSYYHTLYRIALAEGNNGLAFQYLRWSDVLQQHQERMATMNRLQGEKMKSMEIQQNQYLLYAQRNNTHTINQLNANVRLALAAGALFLVLAYIFYRFFRQKKRDASILAEQKDQIEQQATELEAQATELEAQASELEAQANQLEAQNTSLIELGQFREGLTGMLVHDLKNPLNVILGMSQPQEGTQDPDKERIWQSGQHMLQMVLNMLDVQKYEHTTMPCHPSRNRLDTTLLQAQEQVHLLLEAKNIHLNLSGRQGVVAKFDKELVARVLVNLLTNAIKYSPVASTIALEVAVAEEATLQLKVADQGIGIAQEDLPHIFDKFWQSKAQKSGVAPSTGLGLTFCQMAMAAHEGRIVARSSPGEGTIFTLYFPHAVKEKGIEADEAANGNIAPILSQADKASLAPLLEEIKTLEIVQVGLLLGALGKAPKNGSAALQAWQRALEAAIFEGQEEQFRDCLAKAQLAPNL